jgi:hypothetical protein
MRWAASNICSWCHDILSHLKPKVKGKADHGLKPLLLCAQINISSFWLLRYFVTVTKYWLAQGLSSTLQDVQQHPCPSYQTPLVPSTPTYDN